MIGIVDVQGVIVYAKAAALARALAEESKATAGTLTQVQREDLLFRMVLRHIAVLVPVAARARKCSIVLERQRSGVLYFDPAATVDLTADVVSLYDSWLEAAIEKHGRDTFLQATRDQLAEALRAQQGGEETRPGQYL